MSFVISSGHGRDSWKPSCGPREPIFPTPVLNTVEQKKRQDAELDVADLKLLKFSFGVMRFDRIMNVYIRGICIWSFHAGKSQADIQATNHGHIYILQVIYNNQLI